MTSDEATPPVQPDNSSLLEPPGQSGGEMSQPTPDTGLETEGMGRSRQLIGSPTGLLLALAGVVITIYGMRYARDILNPILLSLFLVMGLSPFIHWLRRKGLPPWATLVVVLILFVAVVLLFLAHRSRFLDPVGRQAARRTRRT